MITQKAISAKIDTTTLQQLDEALRRKRYSTSRNNAINRALEMYILLAKIEESFEGLSPGNREKFIDKCHSIYRRWR